MKALYRYLLERPTTRMLVAFTAISFMFNYWASKILMASYIESKFPVPYFVAQLSFNPEKLKGWYSFLINEGTLDIYLRTQHIDTLFIISTLLLHGIGLVMLSRLFSKDSKGRKIMVVCALISAIAPISDQLENVISYVMLMNPTHFSGGLAYVYSSFAALKFAFFVFAYITAIIGLIAGLISLALRTRSTFTKHQNI